MHLSHLFAKMEVWQRSPLFPLKCIKVNNARLREKSLCPPRLSEVKKAMNMKCAMNK